MPYFLSFLYISVYFNLYTKLNRSRGVSNRVRMRYLKQEKIFGQCSGWVGSGENCCLIEGGWFGWEGAHFVHSMDY